MASAHAVATPPAVAPAAPPSAPVSPVKALSAFLWAEHDHELAGAVDSAEGRLEDGLLVLRFAAGRQPLADLVDAAAARRRLEAACQRLALPVSGLKVEVAEDQRSLLATAAADPAVVLVQRVIGGDLVSAWPDDGPVS